LDQHVKHIHETWALVEKIGLEKFGVVMFKNIFKVAPEALQLFPFKDVPNLYQSDIMKSHALKVVTAIGKAI